MKLQKPAEVRRKEHYTLPQPLLRLPLSVGFCSCILRLSLVSVAPGLVMPHNIVLGDGCKWARLNGDDRGLVLSHGCGCGSIWIAWLDRGPQSVIEITEWRKTGRIYDEALAVRLLVGWVLRVAMNTVLGQQRVTIDKVTCGLLLLLLLSGFVQLDQLLLGRDKLLGLSNVL